MRTVTIPEQIQSEEIQSVEYQVGAFVRVVVGHGAMNNGTFEFTVPQQFQTYIIVDKTELINPDNGEVLRPECKDFTNLTTQYPNGSWSTDDLWPYIDLIRSRG